MHPAIGSQNLSMNYLSMRMMMFHGIAYPPLNWADVFPFGLSSKSELLQLNGIDLPSQLATLPAYEILSRLDTYLD